MWIWLIISMVLVVACIIFGIYSFLSSRTLQRSMWVEPVSAGLEDKKKLRIKSNLPLSKQQAILGLKLKSIEENSLLNNHQLIELQKKVEVLETAGNLNAFVEEEKWNDSDEDWEKMYYKTRQVNESLEIELKAVKDVLQAGMQKLKQLEIEQSQWTAIKSDADSVTNEVRELKSSIEQLHFKLEGAKENEEKLQTELSREKSKSFEYENLENQNQQLRSQVEMLTNMVQQIKERKDFMEKNIQNLTELGSYLEISEYEKMRIKNSVEQLLYKK